jgi:hypothetical protein
MKEKSMLGAIALAVGASAFTGETWKSIKRNFGWIVPLAIVVLVLLLPFYGGRNLVRGYPRGAIFQSLWGILSGILLIAAGAALAVGLAAVFGAYVIDPQSSSATADKAALLAWGAGFAGVPAVIGLGVGAFQRPGRRKRFAIAETSK